MTLDVYAQLEQRAKRDHGTSFDRLVRQARDLHGEVSDPSDATQLALKKPQPGNQAIRAFAEPHSSFTKNPAEQRKKKSGETRNRTEDTTIFR
jgi:hypothetical protein